MNFLVKLGLISKHRSSARPSYFYTAVFKHRNLYFDKPTTTKCVHFQKLIPKMNVYKNYIDDRAFLSSYSDNLPSLVALENELLNVFKENEIPDAESSVRLIIQHVLKQDFDSESKHKTYLTKDEVEQIRKLSECRLARMPVQYIIKEWDFRELCLAMVPPVFIPRPETEQLVALVLQSVSADQPLSVLEVGCGSGAICLSLLQALPLAQVVAVDQSMMACLLTKKNAEINGLTKNLQVVKCKVREDGSVSETLPLTDGQIDVMVSNPPYVPSAQLLQLQPEIHLYEDLRALEAGRDGLRVIKSVLLLSQTVLRSEGQVFLEVDCTQPPLVEEWLRDNPQLCLRLLTTVQDYCGRDRFLHLVKE